MSFSVGSETSTYNGTSILMVFRYMQGVVAIDAASAPAHNGREHGSQFMMRR